MCRNINTWNCCCRSVQSTYIKYIGTLLLINFGELVWNIWCIIWDWTKKKKKKRLWGTYTNPCFMNITHEKFNSHFLIKKNLLKYCKTNFFLLFIGPVPSFFPFLTIKYMISSTDRLIVTFFLLYNSIWPVPDLNAACVFFWVLYRSVIKKMYDLRIDEFTQICTTKKKNLKKNGNRGRA